MMAATRLTVRILLSTVCCFLLAYSWAGAQQLKVVSPSIYHNKEAPDRVNNVADFRYQQVVPATDFGDLSGSWWLTQMAMRPDAEQINPYEIEFESLQIRLAKTDIEPGVMDTRLNENLDEDVVPPVFDASGFSFSSEVVKAEEGTNEFDLVVPFDRPFEFNPDDGNLIIDWIQIGAPELGVDFDSIPAPEKGLQALSAELGDEEACCEWGGTVVEFGLVPLGDLDRSGRADASDFDLLAQKDGGIDPWFDSNVDGFVNEDDRDDWVQSLIGTWYGDANLDGEFNSGDLVEVFQAGEYEDGVPMNSGWSTGDWNGDTEFGSGDLVIAFQDGGFEQGPRMAANVVPEPTSLVMIINGVIGFVSVLRTRRNRI